MGWGDKRDMILAENAALKREVELLREMLSENKEERAELKTQLHHTQEALIAKESPEAYRDKKYAEEQADIAANVTPSDEQREAARIQQLRANTASKFLQETEGSLFKDADDMIDLLMPSLGVPMSEDHSLHGNDES